MVVACALKHMGALRSGQVLWLDGVPWFSMPFVAAIQVKLHERDMAGLQAQIDEKNASERAGQN
jgi:hypothetical protein